MALDPIRPIQPIGGRALKKPALTDPTKKAEEGSGYAKQLARSWKAQDEAADAEFENVGAFGHTLRWADKLGQSVRSAMVGDWSAAGRHLGDFVLDPVDALLVGGDWIPALTKRKDYREFSDVLDEYGVVDKNNLHWAAELGLDIAGGIATDPLSFVSFGGVGGAKKGAQAVKRAGKLGQDVKLLSRMPSTMDDLAKQSFKKSDDLMKTARQMINKPGFDVEEVEKITRRADSLAGLGRRRASIAKELGAKLEKSKVALGAAKEAASDAPVMSLGIPFSKAAMDVPITRRQIGDFVKGVVSFAKGITPKALKEPGRGLVNGIKKMASTVSEQARALSGNLKTGYVLDDMIRKGVGYSSQVQNAEMSRLKHIFKDVPKGSDLSKAISRGLRAYNDGIRYVDGKAEYSVDLIAKWDKAVDAAVAATPGVDPEVVRKVMVDVQDLNADMWDNIVESGGYTGKGIKKRYYPRKYDRLKNDSYSMAHRKLKGKDLAEFINRSDVELNEDVISTMLHRQKQQASLALRGRALSELLDSGEAINDAHVQKGIAAVLHHIQTEDKDLWKVLKNLLGKQKGLPEGLMKAFVVNNRIFKPAATAGLFVPRFNFMVRNKLSSVWQHLSTEGGRPMQAFKSIPEDLLGSFLDGVDSAAKGMGIGKGRFKPMLKMLDDAVAQGRGNVARTREILKAGDTEDARLLLEAIDNGVLQGFTTSEDMLGGAGMFGPAKWRKFNNVMTWPLEMNASMEARMRLGAFVDMRRAGKSAEEAAQITENALLAYGLLRGSPGYRTMRHVIPFFAFTAQTIPQQAGFLKRYPAAAVALAQVYGTSPTDRPVEPWIGEQLSIDLGPGAEGTRKYLTTLGLPVESLGDIPDISSSPRKFGRSVERELVGSANPLLKTFYSIVSNKAPYFGGKWATFARTPYIAQTLGAPPESEAARQYRAWAGTGLMQPVVSVEKQLSRATDPRISMGEKALTMLTGARLAHSDPDRAIVRMIQDELATDPKAKTHLTYYGGSESTDELLRHLKEARKRIKERAERRNLAQDVQ